MDQVELHERLLHSIAVYWAYGDDGELLYVGLTNDWPRRWREHGPMAWEVKRLEFEWFLSREEAEPRERQAIIAGKPKYNSAHHHDIGAWRRLTEVQQ